MKGIYSSLLLFSILLVGFIPVAVISQDPEPKTIVFDYSHGQYNSNVESLDQMLAGNLTEMGYDVVFAKGGINSSILADADGLIIGSIYGPENGFLAQEVGAIASWYYQGGRFMWICYDNDYAGYTYINDNMTMILETVGSHVYGEPSWVLDPISNCGAEYRVVATGTSSNPVVSAIGSGVNKVLLHGSTLLYGSDSDTPSSLTDRVALETNTINNVYPILYYNESAFISDGDLVPPIAHDDGEEGAFVASTIELGSGLDGSCVLAVSGASPYGDYRPMCADEYYDVILDGMAFVTQVIDFGLNNAHEQSPPVITTQYASLVANSSILINATISDESNVEFALLFYTLDNWASISNITMTNVSGSLWECEIPWPGYSVTIQYMISAVDEFGNYGVSQIISISGLEAPTTPTSSTSSTSTTPSSTTSTSSTSSTPTAPTSPVFSIETIIIIIGGAGGIIIIIVVVYYLKRSRS